MAERNEALVKPELLIWARETSGMPVSLAATKCKLAEDRLQQYECGELRPTVRQLETMADVYKRPLAVFFMSKPPGSPEKSIEDFRNKKDAEIKRSPQLLYQLRNARFRREVALELYEELEGTPPPSFEPKASLDDRPEKVADKVRQLLGISLASQTNWDNEYQAFSAWRAALEQLYILVFQVKNLETSEMRGFSIAAFPMPVIAVNPKDSVQARIFSLMHEFCHLLLRREGMCDFSEASTLDDSAQTEIFCNSVAASILVPEKAFLQDLKSLDTSEVLMCTRELAKKYWVSQYVILRRMLSVKAISKQQYEAHATLFDSPSVGRKEKNSSPIPQHRLVLSSSGCLFPRIVMNSYDNKKITGADVSEYLSVKVKHFDQIKEALHNKAIHFDEI